jgi:pantetheine-phosphate adenylyltransferase
MRFSPSLETEKRVSSRFMSMSAVYSGTFDPITLGHEDVIVRAAKIFDRLTIGVSAARQKQPLFSLEERIKIAQDALRHVPNVSVVRLDGLMVDFCLQHGIQTIVRGIRNATDLDYEAQMAAMNRKMSASIDTIFLLPEPSLQCISSTLVREISLLGGDTSKMVSPCVAQALQAKHHPVPHA